MTTSTCDHPDERELLDTDPLAMARDDQVWIIARDGLTVLVAAGPFDWRAIGVIHAADEAVRRMLGPDVYTYYLTFPQSGAHPELESTDEIDDDVEGDD